MAFDKSIWPCFTPDLYWALSDDIHNVATLKSIEDDVVEYSIMTNNLPDGKVGLWRFNALRNIKIGLDAWPQKLRSKIQSATLCLGDKALQEVRGDLVFSMFTGDAVLPLFVVDDDPLIVRIMIRPALTDNERLLVPPKCIDASGLLVKIRSTRVPFFVAGCSDSILSWDGQQSRVVSAHLIRSENSESDSHSDSHSDSELIDPLARWNVVNNDAATFEDMWSSLQTSDVLGLRFNDLRETREPRDAERDDKSVKSDKSDQDSFKMTQNTTTFFMPTPR